MPITLNISMLTDIIQYPYHGLPVCGATPYQVNLNLFLGLHLNTSSLRSLSSRLEFLKLIIVIFFFNT